MFWAAPALSSPGAVDRSRVDASSGARLIWENHLTKPCLDCGDWVVVAFLFAFSATGAAYIFGHPSDVNFVTWTGVLGVAGGVFHWLRVRDQKQADAQ